MDVVGDAIGVGTALHIGRPTLPGMVTLPLWGGAPSVVGHPAVGGGDVAAAGGGTAINLGNQSFIRIEIERSAGAALAAGVLAHGLGNAPPKRVVGIPSNLAALPVVGIAAVTDP